jgi:hypothetical protein
MPRPKREIEEWQRPLRGVKDYVFIDEHGVKIRKPSDLIFYDPNPPQPIRRKRKQKEISK